MTDWFVLNARDAEWIDCPLGKCCGFERDDARFEQLGINLNVLQPGEPMTMYHREGEQEDFLVLDGDCVLAVGARSGAKGLVYPVDPVAGKYHASVSAETTEAKAAYNGIEFRDGPYKEGWLAD